MVRLLLAAIALSGLLAVPAAAAPRVVGGEPVQCLAASDWAAYQAAAGLPGAKGIYDEQVGTISLPAHSCELLAALGRGYAPHQQLRAYALAEAVFVFGHELQHAAGIDDEAQADCIAARTLPQLAQRLGASKAYAIELAGYVPSGLCA